MKYSKNAEAIPDSKIRSMMVRAASIPDVISFAVGEPDFDPPEAVIAATKAALDNRDTRYSLSAGIPELREEYAHYLSCLLYTSPSPRDRQKSRMPSSA